MKFVLLALLCIGNFPVAAWAADLPALREVQVTSSLDKSQQPALLWTPPDAKTQSTPLFVFLHSWSGDYHQKNDAWQQQAVDRGWIFLHPNFRGPNKHPDACGSQLARQDIIDAMDFVIKQYQVDPSRVYLAGASGGGHMSMLMAVYFPQRFSAVSAWVGISDLTEWYRFHTKDGVPQNYAQMILKSCGGAPGTSAKIDAEYKSRSPLFHLHNVGDLPIDINAGVQDGHTGSVPISHSMLAYNVIAKSNKHALITDAEMQELWEEGHLKKPQPGDTGFDATYDRNYFLRRHAGKTRCTIFDGGHEGIAQAGCAWLATQHRKTRSP